jgi:hypothetical protein
VVAADAKKSFKPKKVALPARHDPADMPFRRAPMSEAVRSVHIPLATNLHVAFDTELLRAHVAWQGETLNLWGAAYHQGKDRFYCDFNGTVLWTNPPVFPWAVGTMPDKPATEAPTGARFLGISTKGGETTLRYEIPAGKDGVVGVSETPLARGGHTIARRVEVGPCSETLWLLANLMTGAMGSSGKPKLAPGERLVAVAVAGAPGVEVNVGKPPGVVEQRVWIEEKNESVQRTVPRAFTAPAVWVKIPWHTNQVRFELITASAGAGPDGNLTRDLPIDLPQPKRAASKVIVGDKTFLLPAGDESYRLEHFPVPKEIELGVTGMDFLPDGDLAVCTWLGDVYFVQKPTGAPAAATYRRFARGLCEPGGLKVIEGDIYIVQKQELTRLRDTDGDGEADLFECISQDWGHTGNYHDFSFGPTLDRDGNFHVFRIGAHGVWGVPFMGWDIVVSRDGRTVTPFCSGLRSPDGFGTYEGDIFMTENQGNWQGAGKLNHLQKGRFYGYPSTQPATKEQFEKPTKFDPPAVWFPYNKLSKSASGIETIRDERFGPFKGQLLIGEFQNALVMRVFLEKVNGEWQGCVWPFAKGFNSGVNRLSYGPDGKLYVGGLKNGAWAAVAPKDFSLDRVSFTGKVPFEIKEVRTQHDGFELTFTQPCDPATAGKADNWDVSQYRTEYHSVYGSPEFDFDGKPDSASEVKVVSAAVSSDKLHVRLKLDGWRAGYVATIRALDVTNADGKALRNDTCWYTLNAIPN